MATKKEFRDFIFDIFQHLNLDFSVKPMMGEYLIYVSGKLIGGLYDGRLLLKNASYNKVFNLPLVVPYNGAKPMCYIEDFENGENLKKVILSAVESL